MASVSCDSCVHQIGEVSGQVWHKLDQAGPLSSYTKLVKQTGVPRDVAMHALGWLAREGKIHIQEASRGRVVSLIKV